jgi:hypothetical protein
MPLVITDAQMDEALDVMEAGLAALPEPQSRPAAEHAVVS